MGTRYFIDLKKYPELLDEIDSRLSKCFRAIFESNLITTEEKQKEFDERLQNNLDENFKLILGEELVEIIADLASRLSKKEIKRLECLAKFGTIKISSDYYAGIAERLYCGLVRYPAKAEYLRDDIAGQTVFSFCFRLLLFFYENRKMSQYDVQKLVDKYLRFSERKKASPLLLINFGAASANDRGFVPIVDNARLSKGAREYVLHKEKIAKWVYVHADIDPKIGNAKKFIATVPSFWKVGKKRKISIVNLDLPPEFWDWSCTCEDFWIHHHRKKLVLCLHVAAVIWCLIDKGLIKQPWEKKSQQK